VLYWFKSEEGAEPVDNLVLDSAGNLYGTTSGCNTDGCGLGSVFELKHRADGTWGFKELYRAAEIWGPVVFDRAGNLYGTDLAGGPDQIGQVYELTPQTNGEWQAKTLYNFDYGKNGLNGYYPVGGLVLDSAGNLYGVAESGGNFSPCQPWGGCGTVFELTPSSDGTWKESVLFRFNRKDGLLPNGGLIFDAEGNLYGAAQGGESEACQGYCDGVIFELVPQGDGQWKEKILHTFDTTDGAGPNAPLTFDSSGNLYGTTYGGGATCFEQGGCGTVFELMPTANGEWTPKVLFKFRGGDGAYPSGGLILDNSGNLYGETEVNNSNGGPGTVFEITP
jgi:uncharacterized repeat protein (TIGR03803 family)